MGNAFPFTIGDFRICKPELLVKWKAPLVVDLEGPKLKLIQKGTLGEDLLVKNAFECSQSDRCMSFPVFSILTLGPN